MLSVTIIRKGVVDEMTLFKSDTLEERQKAEAFFLSRCGDILTNWDEYTQDDKDAILDNGYESFGDGSICIGSPDESFEQSNKPNPNKVMLVFNPCSFCDGDNEQIYQPLYGTIETGGAICPECGRDLDFDHVLVEK